MNWESPSTGFSTPSATSALKPQPASSAKRLKCDGTFLQSSELASVVTSVEWASETFRDLYAEARDAGLRLTAHAGETAGPESIWGALNIGTERIGHGLSAIHDQELMDLLAERQVPVEICVTSNLRTGCCTSVEDHPLRRYFDSGLMVTLNSDDPALFGSDLEGEYEMARKCFAFTDEQLRELAANSIEASFLPPEKKVMLLRCIESLE